MLLSSGVRNKFDGMLQQKRSCYHTEARTSKCLGLSTAFQTTPPLFGLLLGQRQLPLAVVYTQNCYSSDATAFSNTKILLSETSSYADNPSSKERLRIRQRITRTWYLVYDSMK